MHRQGFTLVEALVTIVIIGALGLLAFPTISGSVSRQGAWNARAVAIGLFNRARTAATESGRSVTLTWAGNVAVITATPRLTAGVGTVDTIGTPLNFGASYGVTVTGTPAPTLTVDPRGLGSSPATTLYFTRNGIQDSLLVTGYGRVVK